MAADLGHRSQGKEYKGWFSLQLGFNISKHLNEGKHEDLTTWPDTSLSKFEAGLSCNGISGMKQEKYLKCRTIYVWHRGFALRAVIWYYWEIVCLATIAAAGGQKVLNVLDVGRINEWILGTRLSGSLVVVKGTLSLSKNFWYVVDFCSLITNI